MQSTREKKQMKRSKKDIFSKIVLIFAIISFIAAAAIPAAIAIRSYLNDNYRSEVQAAYTSTVEELESEEILKMFEAARKYNEALLPIHFEQNLAFARENYNNLLNLNGDGIMGYVEIPKINVNLPIYHGTSDEVLMKGVGHLIGSSLPIGGASTHAVIAGHTGMAANRFFTDLPKMEVGDLFYITVLTRKLTYRVTEIHTVAPSESSYLAIQSGKDRCTLITCTPLGSNSYRLLVQGDRVD